MDTTTKKTKNVEKHTTNQNKKIEEMQNSIDEFNALQDTVSQDVLTVLQKYDMDTGRAACILQRLIHILQTKADVKSVTLPDKEWCPF